MLLEISDNDENSYTIDNLEVVFESELNYILDDYNIFYFHSLSDFKQIDDKFLLTNEEDKLIITQEQYTIIKELLKEKGIM